MEQESPFNPEPQPDVREVVGEFEAQRSEPWSAADPRTPPADVRQGVQGVAQPFDTVNISDVESRPLDWDWYPHLVRGYTTLWAGKTKEVNPVQWTLKRSLCCDVADQELRFST